MRCEDITLNRKAGLPTFRTKLLY